MQPPLIFFVRGGLVPIFRFSTLNLMLFPIAFLTFPRTVLNKPASCTFCRNIMKRRCQIPMTMLREKCASASGCMNIILYLRPNSWSSGSSFLQKLHLMTFPWWLWYNPRISCAVISSRSEGFIEIERTFIIFPRKSSLSLAGKELRKSSLMVAIASLLWA